jgi:hypothetical protein
MRDEIKEVKVMCPPPKARPKMPVLGSKALILAQDGRGMNRRK